MNGLENLYTFLFNKGIIEKIKRINVQTYYNLSDTQDGEIFLLKNFDCINNYFGFFGDGFSFYIGDYISFESDNFIIENDDFKELSKDFTIKDLNSFVLKILKNNKIKYKIIKEPDFSVGFMYPTEDDLTEYLEFAGIGFSLND